MAIKINDINSDMGKPDASKNWCNYLKCIYNQGGYCNTGPELVFTGQFNNKDKPIFVCVASYKK